MTPLRQKMIDAMLVRGYSPRTHESYLSSVASLAKYYHRSPELISREEVEAFLLYLVRERQLSDATCRLRLQGIRFLYQQVLGRTEFNVPIPHPKRVRRIPELLTRDEVARLLAASANLKHRMLLSTAYACGLRVSELVAVRVRHLDGERHLLRVEQGKGAKDRQVILPATLLAQLRDYWRTLHPVDWLFPSTDRATALTVGSVQRVFVNAKRQAGIAKVGGIHSLRHAYATHQLAAGVPVQQLQYQLGHSHLESTLRYVHWLPGYRDDQHASVDLLAGLEVRHG